MHVLPRIWDLSFLYIVITIILFRAVIYLIGSDSLWRAVGACLKFRLPCTILFLWLFATESLSVWRVQLLYNCVRFLYICVQFTSAAVAASQVHLGQVGIYYWFFYLLLDTS